MTQVDPWTTEQTNRDEPRAGRCWTRELPLHLAAWALDVPAATVRNAASLGLFKTRLDSSGFKVAVLADVQSALARLNIEHCA